MCAKLRLSCHLSSGEPLFQTIQNPNTKSWKMQIGVLKSVKVAVSGMKCIDLFNNTIKITGIHFSYNKKKRKEKKKF